jgi:hypothetical protein
MEYVIEAIGRDPASIVKAMLTEKCDVCKKIIGFNCADKMVDCSDCGNHICQGCKAIRTCICCRIHTKRELPIIHCWGCFI